MIDSLLNAAVENHEISCASGYISFEGREIFKEAYGWRNMESGEALLENDIFRMASMTKALTAVAILQLLEKGDLKLDDEVKSYIPEFENPQILEKLHADSSFSSRPAQSDITIRQLLTHTSGLGYGFQNDRYNALIIKHRISEGFEDDERTSYDNIVRMAKIPLLFEPGEQYVYSLSMDVLGVVVEQISGLRYDRYITRNILEPLGMDDSYFFIPEEEQARLVSVYRPGPDSLGLEPADYPDTIYPVMAYKQFFSGGSDLCSTAEDYAIFMNMLLNGGTFNGVSILGSSMVDTMLSRQSPLGEEDSYQGFAAWITNEKGAEKGPRSLGSFEFGGFYDTYSWADPEIDLVAVLLLQMYPNNSHSIHQKFQEVIYNSPEESQAYQGK